MHLRNTLFAFGLIVLAMLPDPAAAANRRQSIEELTDESEKVVLGAVVSQNSYWTQDSLIYTDVVISPDVTILGDDEGTVVVQVPGGTVGDTQMTVSDAPEFKQGERVLLFLKRNKDRYEVSGRDAGKHQAGSEEAAAALEVVFQKLEKKSRQKQDYKRALAQEYLNRDAATTTTTSTATTSSCYIISALKWPTGSATFKIGPSVPVIWTNSINAAASTWSNAGAAIRLSNSSTSVNELSYLDLVGKYGSSYANTYAVATVWSNTYTNQITKASIEVNTRFQWSTTAQANMADVQNILTHEFGHWMRMADIYSPSTCGEATMWGTAFLGETKKRTLDQADINGLISLYGRTSTIAAPVLSAPANGGTGVSRTPSLVWGAAAGATSYQVYLGTTASPALVATVTGTSYQPGTLLAGVTYYWRVVSKNATGSASSATWSFTTTGGTLTAPVLVSPANGATGLSLTPVLQWNPVAGATSYEVHLGTSSPILIGSTTATAVTIGGLKNATLYYWKIVARGSSGTAASTVRWFRTQ
jgi:hypothetical protein